MSSLSNLLRGVQAMHYTNFQGLNAQIRSEVCTMLLGCRSGLKQNNYDQTTHGAPEQDCQFNLEIFPPNSLCTGPALTRWQGLSQKHRQDPLDVSDAWVSHLQILHSLSR